MRDCEVYFTCEAEEKLVPQVIEFVGEDRIMISADMPHGEAREGSVQEIRERSRPERRCETNGSSVTTPLNFMRFKVRAVMQTLSKPLMASVDGGFTLRPVGL